MKVLDVHGFHTGTKEIQKNIKLLQEQIEAIREAVHQIIHLEDSLKGKGGESIRNYYQHIHETFLQFFQSFLTNYDTIIGEMQRALQQFEPAENGFIHEGFIDMNVPQGLKKIRDITESLTNEANQIMASVQDIVSLPRLEDEATLRGIEQGRVRAKKTIEDLYFFDQQATRTLDSVEKDIQTMTAFVQQANAMFEGDKRIVIDFNPEKLKEGEGYRNLVAELYSFTEEENKSALDKIIGLEKTEIPISKGEIPWGPGRIIKVGELGKVVKVISKRLLPKMSKGTGKYQVGAYKDIKGVEGLDAHHVGQKALMKDFVENYDLNTAPAINVPKVGHTIKGPNGIVSRSTKGIENPRQLLARDIMELRRVYDDIPNSALKELIELNKKMYPEMRK